VTLAWLWHRPAGAQEAGPDRSREPARPDLFPRRCVRVLAAVAFPGRSPPQGQRGADSAPIVASDGREHARR